jgi:hypothetical protein
VRRGGKPRFRAPIPTIGDNSSIDTARMTALDGSGTLTVATTPA